MASYQATVLADSPVLFMPLSESSGNFLDLSTNGFVGTPHAPITRSVASGFAGVGNGIQVAGGAGTGYVSIPSAAAGPLDITGDVTFEAWYATSTFASQEYLAAKGGSAGSGGYGWAFAQTTGQFQVVDVSVGGVWNSGFIGSGDSVVRHMVVTRSGNTWTFYSNGSQTNQSASATNVQSNATEFEIGAGFDGSAGQRFWTGSLFSVALYNYALSSARVSAHYGARNNATAGGGGTQKVPSGQIVAALVQARNAERQAERKEASSLERQRHRMSDYYRKQRRSG